MLFFMRLEFILSLIVIFIGVAIGGDVFPGSTLSDHVLRFNNIPQVYQFIGENGYFICIANIFARGTLVLKLHMHFIMKKHD